MSAGTPLDEPVATVAAVTEQARRLAGHVQRFGLRSASAVVDRYIGLVERALTDDVVLPAASPQARRDPATFVEGAARMAQSYLAMIDTLAAATPPGTSSSSGRRDDAVLAQVSPGQSTRTELWVHNAASTTLDDLSLTVSDLHSAGGRRLPSAAMTLECPRSVPAGGAGTVHILVEVPVDQPPGRYHGLVLASAAPEEPLLLTVHVLPRPGELPVSGP